MSPSPPPSASTVAAAPSPGPRERASESPAESSNRGGGDDDDRSVESDNEAPSDGEVSEDDINSGLVADSSAPPLPNEAAPGGPPLPNEPAPSSEDDGWDCQWDAASQTWFFYNRFTGKTQWDNPRLLTTTTSSSAPGDDGPRPPAHEQPAAGGYNPAIHGDYDPNAWYAKSSGADETDETAGAIATMGADGWGDDAATDSYASSAAFNRFTGQFQAGDVVPSRHGDEAKSRRQMNSFFDVDAAANAHDGRSLKAERTNKKPSKTELKAFKEKRRARKEEKRRAWLRD